MSAFVATNNWPVNKQAQRAYEALQELCKGSTADQPFGIGWHSVDAIAVKSGVSVTALYRYSNALAKMPGVRIKTFTRRSNGGVMHAMRFDALQ